MPHLITEEQEDKGMESEMGKLRDMGGESNLSIHPMRVLGERRDKGEEKQSKKGGIKVSWAEEWHQSSDWKGSIKSQNA